MNLSFILFCFLNTLFVVAVSPLFIGVVKKVKALAQGRCGPPLLQQYHNLLKLMKKETIYSSNSSWVMRATPYINITVLITASLFVPLAFIPEHPFGIGNIIVFLYLLAVARFFMALAGLDAGSTFGGMGSSREMSISSIIEPITIIVFTALVFTTNTLNLHEMFLKSASSLFLFNPTFVLTTISLFIIILVETARVPVDNPETHLELTMVHEAMLLEYSGRDIALMELSNAVKQTLLMAILINIIFPWGLALEMSLIGLIIALSAFVLKGVFLSAVIGIFESSIAKSRLFLIPNLFMIAFFLSILTIFWEVFR